MTRREFAEAIDALDAEILRARRLSPAVRKRLPPQFEEACRAAIVGGLTILDSAPEGHKAYANPELEQIRAGVAVARREIERALAAEAKATAKRGLLN